MTTALPIGHIQNMEINVTGVFRYTDTWPAAIHLVTSGAVDLDGMVTGRYDLEHVGEALDSDTDPASLKSIVVPRDGVPHEETPIARSPFDLTGRTALVTGGNQGLGRAFAFGLAEAGATVAIAGRSAERNEKVVAEAAGAGPHDPPDHRRHHQPGRRRRG